ncbi:MAG: magnesium transporter [Pirellulales bacterium]|nr:magnesium transporter [Pirellulales bacterium]
MPYHNARISHLNDPVTQHMRTGPAVVCADQTVGEAIAASRSAPPSGRIIYFYAVDAHGCLEGVVPTRRLLLSSESTAIRDIMVRNVITIPCSATVLDACEFFLLYRLLAFPILDEGRRILGVVDVDLYTNELADLDRREDTDDLFQLIGVHFRESQQRSSLLAFQSRFPWLIANIIGGLVAAFLTGVFQRELEKALSLALFIPVVLALAESVAIQSVSLTLQVLHSRQPTLKSIIRMLRVESITGILLGSTSAVIVAFVSFLWLHDMTLMACLLSGIAGGVVCASIIGAAIPNIIKLVHREPQVAAGPIALAATDMTTLVIYLLFARWLLS